MALLHYRMPDIFTPQQAATTLLSLGRMEGFKHFNPNRRTTIRYWKKSVGKILELEVVPIRVFISTEEPELFGTLPRDKRLRTCEVLLAYCKRTSAKIDNIKTGYWVKMVFPMDRILPPPTVMTPAIIPFPL